MLENKRQKQKKLTRKHLIEVAIKQFGENGILKTRTSDIAKAADVSHGTVFAMVDFKNEYFKYSCHPDGTMQSYDEKLNYLTSFIIKTQGIDEKAANFAAKSMMSKLPAWQTEANIL
ncbi:TetR family transcriptional regulator [Clostridium estertheticum]|uniref:TetR family transcriptional regulator n=1 Tax=Clostridium estertheticum TaxID=238834 RepID=UPI001CF4FE68|nr:TetR family transcriptional regulator [Clostridium estertheticum]MCB2360619.1 TetR family transcriptional regulator [Clostridium estertheticum]